MVKKVGQEVAKSRLLAQIAMGAGNGDKSWARSISNIWSEFLRCVYYMEAQHENLEKDMQEEYKRFSHLRPKMTIQQDGSLKVTGIPNSSL
jgi:hypothetical protein